MVLKYEAQIAALNAAIAKLDADLAGNPTWLALHQLKHNKTVSTSTLDRGLAPLHLEQELARDPVYRARVRLLEAVQALQNIPSNTESQSLKLSETLTKASNSSEQAASVRITKEMPSLSEPKEEVGDDGSGPQTKAKVSANAAEDDLTLIRGITPSLNERLNALGITRFAQIAAWTSQDRQNISKELGLGREILRYNWIDQAALRVAKSTRPAKTHAAPASVAPPTPAPAIETPHVLIKSAAEGLVRRLQASNDTEPAMTTPQTPLQSAPDAPTASVAQSREATKPVTKPPLRPQSQIVFSPQILPEPRRVVAAQRRQRAEQDQLVAKASVSLGPAQDEVDAPRTSTQAEAKPISSAASQTLINQGHTAGKLVLPKDKLRFRRLKPKAKASTAANPTNTETTDPNADLLAPASLHGPSNRTGEVGNAEVVIHRPDAELSGQTPEPADGLETASGVLPSPNPLSPPPVPGRDQKNDAFMKRRWMRRNGPYARQGGQRSNFGDGHLWRQEETILNGPELEDAAGLDGRIYAHTEEASVEIVRPRPKEGLAIDPPPIHTDQPSGVEVADEGAKSILRHPAKRIFKALKRE